MKRAHLFLFFGVLFSAWVGVGTTQASDDFPFEGEVKTGNLHVRSGPGVNFTVLGDVHKGERLTVVEKKGDWLKVQIPETCRVWVAARYVEWKEGDVEGLVKGNDVNLRAAGSFNAESLAKLSAGDKVRIFKRVGDWFEAAPVGIDVFAWVSAKYVSDLGTSDPDAAEWLSIRKLYQQEMDKEIRSRNLDGVLARSESLATSCRNPRVKERVDLFIQQIREEAEWCRKLSTTELERKQAVQAIQQKYEKEIKSLINNTPPGNAYLLTGWLYECGNIIGGAPGTHKLVKGGKLVAYVRGNNVDLKKYYGKYVGVNGEDSYHPRYQEPVIVIQAAGQIQTIGTGE